MKVLVTGAMGQLGRLVTALLLQRGHTVIALDLPGPLAEAAAAQLRPQPGTPGTLVPAFVDLLDRSAIQTLLPEHDPAVIVHLAAIVSPPCYRNPEFARRVNVQGTRNLVDAARGAITPPLLLQASSSAVYGSRNPYRDSRRLAPDTPVRPIECYGEDKIAAERYVAGSGLPYALLRLAGIISPQATGSTTPEYLVLMRATPRDNRLHAIDARDAALAFANAAERGAAINGKVLMIAGNDSCAKLQFEIQDDVTEALGLGRIGPSAALPGDPSDDRGWSFTDWFDTSEAQALLDFQKHDWSDTLAWMAQSQGRKRRLMQLTGPLLRPLLRAYLAAQRRRERRGPYADPWGLISRHFGTRVLAPTEF